MSIPPIGLEVQVAVLAHEVQALRRDVDELRAEMRGVLDQHGLRELAREVVREETAGDTTVRDNAMRIVTFGISIVTAFFVIRGGR